MGARAQARRQMRRDARLARKQAKQAGKTARVEARGATKQAAYKAGIDPGAKWTSLGGKALDIGAGLLGGKNPAPKSNDQAGGAMGVLPIVAAAAGIYFLTKK